MLDLAIRAPLERADLPGLHARVCARLQGAEGQLVRVDISGVAVDAVAVDALARLKLGARRHGCELQILGASEELLMLVALMGLERVLRPAS
jgi:ABC-type transporter Mla MlaB component